MPLPAYAQNAEDVMLWRLFKNQTSGVYVDVGAQDPEVDSVTKRFYDHGWFGLNIEPVSTYHEALKKERPRDINLDVLVGAIDGELTFYHIEGTGLSTTRADLAATHAKNGCKVNTETLPIFRLQTLLERHGIAEVDFLKIDTEGSEADVLLGLDFNKTRPKVLVIESTLPNSREESHHDWEPRLLAHGYHLAYRDGLNRFYLDTPYLDWMVHFELPPNHFDDYLPAKFFREKQLSNEAQLHLHKTILASQELINALQTEIARKTQDMEHAVSVLNAEIARKDKEKEHAVKTLNSAIYIRDQEILRITDVFESDILKKTKEYEYEISDLHCEIARQKEFSIRDIKDVTNRLEEEIKHRDNHIARLNADMAHLSAELARISGELAHVRAVHERAVRTWSWRLTSPLRLVNPIARQVLKLPSQAIQLLKPKTKRVSPIAHAGPPPVDSMPEAGRWLIHKLSSGD